MQKITCLLVLLITCSPGITQNLIPNGDFELNIGCPNNFGHFYLASPWQNTSPGIYRTEYFHPCAITGNPTFAAPSNLFGYQNAQSGVAYCGLYLFSVPPATPEYREYIEAPLTQTLTAGVNYHFQMAINLANQSKFTGQDFGIYFSDTLLSGFPIGNPLTVTPQMNNLSAVITDTANWTIVSGNYTASGNENYIIIGNFMPDSLTNTVPANSNGGIDGGYFYIDNVCLATDSLDCISIVAIKEKLNKNDCKLYPNPFKDKIIINSQNHELIELCLFDFTYGKILNQFFNSNTEINTTTLPKGFYFYELRNQTGVFQQGKLIKD